MRFFFAIFLSLPQGDHSTRVVQLLCSLRTSATCLKPWLNSGTGCRKPCSFHLALVSNVYIMQAASHSPLPQPRFNGTSKIRLWEIWVAAGHILLFPWQGTDNWRTHFVCALGNSVSPGTFLFMCWFWRHILNWFPTFWW